MAVRRIVTNIATDRIEADRIEAATAFYSGVLGLSVVMDLGWIITFAADAQTTPQISIATEGGAGTPVPDISIEVDDFDAVHQRAVAAGFRIEYGPMTESWGVRRFYVRDPFGRMVNILAHT
jgi:catechol 2,3-dioxygenase-like lactoylglutathione lyase family enzyme